MLVYQNDRIFRGTAVALLISANNVSAFSSQAFLSLLRPNQILTTLISVFHSRAARPRRTTTLVAVRADGAVDGDVVRRIPCRVDAVSHRFRLFVSYFHRQRVVLHWTNANAQPASDLAARRFVCFSCWETCADSIIFCNRCCCCPFDNLRCYCCC